jgi:hypothetical protein
VHSIRHNKQVISNRATCYQWTFVRTVLRINRYQHSARLNHRRIFLHDSRRLKQLSAHFTTLQDEHLFVITLSASVRLSYLTGQGAEASCSYGLASIQQYLYSHTDYITRQTRQPVKDRLSTCLQKCCSTSILARY